MWFEGKNRNFKWIPRLFETRLIRGFVGYFAWNKKPTAFTPKSPRLGHFCDYSHLLIHAISEFSRAPSVIVVCERAAKFAERDNSLIFDETYFSTKFNLRRVWDNKTCPWSLSSTAISTHSSYHVLQCGVSPIGGVVDGHFSLLQLLIQMIIVMYEGGFLCSNSPS